MASGKLGSASLAAAANTDLYAVPAGVVATVNINLCNRGAASVAVRIAVRSAALADADYIEYGAVIPAGGVLERTAVVCSAGETVTVYAGAAGVSARVHGFEEAVI